MMVNIESRSPIHMQVNSADFGDLFSHMACDDQVSVLRAIVSSMSAHPLQWDYIAIELELPENSDLMAALGRIVASMRIAP